MREGCRHWRLSVGIHEPYWCEARLWGRPGVGERVGEAEAETDVHATVRVGLGLITRMDAPIRRDSQDVPWSKRKWPS
ncbi:hypothetical protein [Acetomicrobium sp.]|uniref:hypothetical protein n=1 Tax=Acetomicrobium sp. TaxID=1872099 RepID=UPI00287193C3|nr:hypothetical protein [Acetomicrobium sp.]MDR9770585.1 hypothetical protein [Acetomicrobium sp.]